MKLGDKELKVTMASFQEANALKNAVGRALKGTRLDLDKLPKNVKSQIPDELLTNIIDAALELGTNEDVERCLFKCAERAVLGYDKITPEFFENEAHREFYFPIMIEVLKVNLGPFFKGLASLFGDLGALMKNIRK